MRPPNDEDIENYDDIMSEKPDVSPYINGSDIPDFIRELILEEQQSEFRRIGAAINDAAIPFDRLEVLTNEPKAVQYFDSLLTKYEILGLVKVKPTEIPQILSKVVR